MTLLAWKPEYAIGLPEVDHEHQQLIALINTLYESVQNDSLEAVTDFLGDIAATISAHFALEEKIMAELRYDGYTAHKDDHERLLDEIAAMIDACLDDEVFDGATLSHRLDEWFTGHFKTHDARMHRLVDPSR